jgi:ABC-type transporter Mla MlaB component
VVEMGQTTPFSVQIDQIGTTDIVTVRGEIDIVSAPEFEEKLSTVGSTIVVDLRHLDFMDSSGLAVLLRRRQTLEGLIRATSRRGAWDYRKTVRGDRDRQGVSDLPRCRCGNRRRWVGFVERLAIDRMTIPGLGFSSWSLRTQADIRLTLVGEFADYPGLSKPDCFRSL